MTCPKAALWLAVISLSAFHLLGGWALADDNLAAELRRANDDELEVLAASASGNRAKQDSMVEASIALLYDTDERMRQRAAHFIPLLGVPSVAAIPDLFNALDDHSESVRRDALVALQDIIGDSLLPKVASMMESDSQPTVRVVAAKALVQLLDKDERSLIRQLEQNGTDLAVLREVLLAVADRAEFLRGTAPALIELLDDMREYDETLTPHFYGKRPIRADVAKALGSLGPTVHGIPEKLRTFIQDESSQVRLWGAYALRALGDTSSALPILKDGLRSDATLVQRDAFQATAALKEYAKPLVPDVLRLLSDDDPIVRSYAVETLPQIAGRDETAIAALTKRLKAEDNEFIQVDVLNSLRSLGPAARNSSAAIREIATVRAGKADDSVRCAAIRAFSAIERGAEVVRMVDAVLGEDQSPEVRRCCAMILGAVQGNSDVRDRLIKRLLEDRDPKVVSEAEKSHSRTRGRPDHNHR